MSDNFTVKFHNPLNGEIESYSVNGIKSNDKLSFITYDYSQKWNDERTEIEKWVIVNKNYEIN